jgi:hypothetical protein
MITGVIYYGWPVAYDNTRGRQAYNVGWAFDTPYDDTYRYVNECHTALTFWLGADALREEDY